MAFVDIWSRTQAFIADLFQSVNVTADVPAAVIVSAFLILLGMEINVTRRSRRLTPVLRQSYRTNLATFLFNDLLLSLLSVSSLLVLAERYAHHGLLYAVDDVSVKAALAFILFDLTIYLWHKANHRLDWLWRFHKVHHSDRSMNVSTAFRLHFAEILLTTAVKALFIIVSGVEVAIVAACEAVTSVFVLFHHANVAFRAERWLGRIFVVPALHRVHHSVQRSEHDSNYGQVFSVWDRIFGTYTAPRPVEVGLRNAGGQSFLELLKFGLAGPGSVQPGPNPMLSAEILKIMIAEAAYYKAETRGFAPGWEVVDWLVAEREIKERIGQI